MSNKVWVGLVVIVLVAAGYLAFVAGHSAASMTPVAAGSSAKAGLISSGEPVDLAAHALASGMTVFEFTAPG